MGAVVPRRDDRHGRQRGDRAERDRGGYPAGALGANILPPVRAHGAIVRFLLQFHSPLIYVLLVSALAAALIGEQVDAAVIFTVLLVNALVGFVHESRAEGALAALAAMTETTSTVVRDGARLPVPSRNVVPGDLVVLEPGDKVPAAKATGALPAGTLLADRGNMAFSSTLVTSGSGVGVATMPRPRRPWPRAPVWRARF